MTKRDTIIIAVLVNTGLLALLFMTAMNLGDNNKTSEIAQASELQIQLPNTGDYPQEEASNLQLTNAQTASGDEVDNVLNQYAQSTQNSGEGQSKTYQNQNANTPYDISSELLASSVETTLPSSTSGESKDVEAPSTPTSNVVDVTVKRGDSLDKIAIANGTSIDAIMKLNNLKSDRLDIGQVLKVPVGKKSADPAKAPVISSPAPAKKQTAKEDTKTPNSSGPQYYTIKSGDNPWKIARQFHVKFEDLLTLNNLDEEKARNLKVGDKIRVK